MSEPPQRRRAGPVGARRRTMQQAHCADIGRVDVLTRHPGAEVAAAITVEITEYQRGADTIARLRRRA